MGTLLLDYQTLERVGSSGGRNGPTGKRRNIRECRRGWCVVVSSINTAYKGDFLSWTINLVKASEGASSEDEIMVVCIPEGQAPDPIELTHGLAERIPYFMVPRYIRFDDSLPKTPTERVQKVKLREARRASRPTPSTVRPPASRSSDSGRVPR